ncbi:beta-carbonic anhydrase, cab [Glarea lozoyensis ATCC 20868]|uniref:Carbonic anhydrase n=1 Tax=Glarea lozoyensis (strain ATCC 20868 / MF5171) TaxID=1116229 RepID=S3CR72_GLAL2|nr:beta-carbonic anhydrase, cab [Glarea lozoyensis ATCC 20868]EPE27604.1 beta-carbonic anhydrase, cab [Glarea lozoyensis ATCC 20868]
MEIEREAEMDPRVLRYLENNRKWAANPEYRTPVRFKEMQKAGRELENGTIIILACTDPRCTPEEFFGMSSERGNKATIIRTAGARAQPALSTLYVLSAVGNLGKKGTIMVVGHTDCGLQSTTDVEIRKVLLDSVREDLNTDDLCEADERLRGGRWGVQLGAFVRPDESVTEDVEMLKRSPFFKGMQILGFVQDTQTGIVEEVESWRRGVDGDVGR